MLINHGGMQAASQNLGTAAQHIKGALDALETNLTNGPRQRWSGEAEVAFTTAHQKWTEAYNELSALLDSIGVKVFDADTMYKGTDMRNAGLFGG